MNRLTRTIAALLTVLLATITLTLVAGPTADAASSDYELVVASPAPGPDGAGWECPSG